MLKKLWFLWVMAVIITLSAVIYQKRTGPTYDKRTNVIIESKEYKLNFPRSNGESDCEIVIEIPDQSVSASIFYRKYPTNGEWNKIHMHRSSNELKAYLPKQPPAGKLQYFIEFRSPNEVVKIMENEPVKIRFKGDVPAFILIPHVLFMFIAMLLSNISGLTAAFKNSKFRLYGNLTILCFFIGGMILGPIVQLYAFGDLWTGIPFGWDLTDNKTLIAFIFWIIAFILNLKKERPVYTVIASVLMLLIYSIPHSMFGSELDPETGKVVQGMIYLLVY